MYVDSRQKSVYDIVRDNPVDINDGAVCPTCNGSVFARRPINKIWHWVHRSKARDCPGGGPESEWHLRMKRALHNAGYALEVWDAGLKLRFDAVTTREDDDFTIVEVVNTHSPKYYTKALNVNLAFGSPPMLWIVNRDNLLASPIRYKKAFAATLDNLKSCGHTVWVFGDKLGEYRGDSRDIITHPLHAHILAEFGEISLRDAEGIVQRRVKALAYHREQEAKNGTSDRTRYHQAKRTLSPYRKWGSPKTWS